MTALLYLLIPGFGQMIEGRFIVGLGYFVFVPLCYLIWFPAGLIMHFSSFCFTRGPSS